MKSRLAYLVATTLATGMRTSLSARAFGSANFTLEKGQFDLGWQILKALHKIRLVSDLVLPTDLPVRDELHRIAQVKLPPVT